MVGLQSALFDELAEIRDSPLGSRLREVGFVSLFTVPPIIGFTAKRFCAGEAS